MINVIYEQLEKLQKDMYKKKSERYEFNKEFGDNNEELESFLAGAQYMIDVLEELLFRIKS